MGICQSKNSACYTALDAKDGLSNNRSIVFVLGGPGSGKGTQCTKLVKEYDCAHISVGDLLRDEVERDTAIGRDCDALMKEGKLVPFETTLALLQSALEKSEKRTILIDGFPRSIEQATRFEAEVQTCTAVLCFDCELETMKKRLIERGKDSGRCDDNAETINKRVETFLETTTPVAQFYESQGKCFRLSAEESPDTVFANVKKALNPYLEASTATNENEVESTEMKHVVFVLGGPGSGKGTQCERIVAEYGYQHVSVGNLLREEVANGTELGQKCNALMNEGQLVPIEVTLDLLKKTINNNDSALYLIDGFPRSVEQAELFEKEVAGCNCVLFFDCSEEMLLERMKERAKNSGRSDDNPETMQKRLKTFNEFSAPVAQYYTNKGLCHKITAERDPAEIYSDVQRILNSLPVKHKPTLNDARSE